METTVYFVRHAKVDYVKDDKIRPLTKEGEDDAKKLVEYFNDKDIHAMFSSPYIRARKTISYLAEEHELEIKEIYDFREREITSWIEDFNEYSTRQWKDFDYAMDNGETLRCVQKRNINALEEVLDECKGKVIVIGTHGTALGCILNYYDNTFGYREWTKLKMPHVVKMTFKGKKFDDYNL